MPPAFSPSILACATCMADKGSAIGQAQGFAILFMLGVLVFMFAIASGIVCSMVRCQRRHAQTVAS